MAMLQGFACSASCCHARRRPFSWQPRLTFCRSSASAQQGTQMRQRRRVAPRSALCEQEARANRGHEHSTGSIQCSSRPSTLLPVQQQPTRTEPSMGQDARRSQLRHRQWHWPLAVAACAAAYVGVQHLSGSHAPEGPRAAQPTAQAAPVHVAVVETRSFPIVLNGLGTVQATNTVTVRSRVDGQIEKVAFEEGQMVREGDLLVQIDPAPFQAALNQATAKLAQDEASLTNAKQDLERTAVLSKQGNATQQLLDQRTANVASLTAQVQADKAAIDSARVQLDYTTIRSPLTGRAGFRLVDPGNIVHANDQNGMLTITQLHPIAVMFTAPADQLPVINDELKAGPLKV